MEQNEQVGTLPLDHIRGLLIRQGARCAITGIPLVPANVNADHIVPLSRAKLSPGMGKNNIWLVHKTVNAMKGTMTYEELVEMARLILAHHDESKALLQSILNHAVKPSSKAAFDKWVVENCAADGRLKNTATLDAIAESEQSDE